MILNADNIRLRRGDEAECALVGLTGREAIRDAVARSNQSFVVVRDGEPIAYWGYEDIGKLAGQCMVWLLATDALDNHRIYAGRLSREVLDWLFETHHEIFMQVDPFYGPAVKWLRWAGFVPWNVNGPFLVMRAVRGGLA